MFDKRLMQMCPESKKYIAGNIVLQFAELCLNALMIVLIAVSVEKLYEKAWNIRDLVIPFAVIAYATACEHSMAGMIPSRRESL